VVGGGGGGNGKRVGKGSNMGCRKYGENSQSKWGGVRCMWGGEGRCRGKRRLGERRGLRMVGGGMAVGEEGGMKLERW